MSTPASSQPVPMPPAGLLRNWRFRRFCFAKFLQLGAQNALIYGLFIFVVQEQESSIATSAFVLASVVPSVLLSVPAGVLADFLPKKGLLVASLIARIAIVWLFIDFELDLAAVILLTFLAWTAYQFFTPPENAALAAVVPSASLPAAISFLHALSLLAQLVGAGIIAPVMIKLASEEALFWTVFAALWLSLALYVTVPNLSPRRPPAGHERVPWWKSLPTGLKTIAGSNELARTTILKVLVDTTTMMVIVAVPIYVEEVLQTGAENTIYIALPGAFGLALGLLVAPLSLSLFSGRFVATLGFVLFLTAISLLPWVDELTPGIFSDAQISPDIVYTSAVILIGGLGVALTQVSARAVVYRETGPDSIGQVLATQSSIGSTAALIPTLASGVLLDLIPVQAVLGLIGFSLAVLGLGSYIRPLGRPNRSTYPTGV